jgi:hypothetical protein
MSVTRQQSGPVRARFVELETVGELPMHVAERLAWRLHLHDRRRLRPRRAATALLRQRGAAGDVRCSACTYLLEELLRSQAQQRDRVAVHQCERARADVVPAPSPVTDVAAVSPSPGADVAGVSPVPCLARE